MRNLASQLTRSAAPALVCAGTFALVAFVAAAAGELPTLDPAAPIDEAYFESSYPATTSFIKGVLLDDLDGDVDVRDLRIHLPESDAPLPDRLCVHLQSIDGRYRGHVAYDLPEAARGPHRLKLGTRYAKRLRRYRARELAALAYLASDCLQRPREVLPLSWGAAGEEAVILVNGLGGDAVLSTPELERQCAASPAGAREAFHLECRLGPLSPGRNVVTVGIYRFEELMDEETVTIWGDGAP